MSSAACASCLGNGSRGDEGDEEEGLESFTVFFGAARSIIGFSHAVKRFGSWCFQCPFSSNLKDIMVVKTATEMNAGSQFGPRFAAKMTSADSAGGYEPVFGGTNFSSDLLCVVFL